MSGRTDGHIRHTPPSGCPHASKRPAGSRRVAWGTLMLASALLGACSSVPVRYYSLAAITDPAVPATAPAGLAARASMQVQVGPVRVPDRIDRLPMVRLSSGGEAEIMEFQRWAAPLKHEISQRLAVRLGEAWSGPARVAAWPQANAGIPDLQIPIDVQQFDTLGQDRVQLVALWSARQAGRELAGGRFVASESLSGPAANSGAGAASTPGMSDPAAAMAAAHARLVDRLAADIARQLSGRL